MKRAVVSVLVGVLGVVALLAPVLMLEKAVAGGAGGPALATLLRACFWALGWPLPLFARIFPNEPGSPLRYSAASLAASLLCDVAVVAAVTYWLTGRRAPAATSK